MCDHTRKYILCKCIACGRLSHQPTVDDEFNKNIEHHWYCGCSFKTKFIIVKYAQDHYPSGKAPLFAAVHPDSFTARQCNVTVTYFVDRNSAEEALSKMKEFNPAVDYGIVELEQ